MGIWIYFIILILTVIFYRFLQIIYKFVAFIRKSFKAAHALEQFPIEPYHWLFGHLLSHPGANYDGLQESLRWANKHPRYYVFHFGPTKQVLMLNHPETVKQILKTSEPKNSLGGGGYCLLRPWIGDGLLVSYGDKWFRNRKLLTPGFHFGVLKPYLEVYNVCADMLLDTFERTSSAPKSSVDVHAPVSLCTLDIMLRCAFSTTRNIQHVGNQDPYVSTVGELGKLVVSRALNPLLYNNSLYYLFSSGKKFGKLCDYSHEVADEVINRRRKELSDGPKDESQKRKFVDFLDILLLARDEHGNGLTHQEIRDEVETFMFEGHDTTASGISWILYNLTRHPDIQAKAREEIDDLLKERPSDTIGWDDLNEMPYLTRCIKESLRLHPPVHSVSRQTTAPTTIDDKVIPADTTVAVNIYNVHHNATVWTDPMRYDPDRFLPENATKMDSHAFIPFSAGPRNCIGQNFAMHEMKTVVARIIRQFELRPGFTEEVRTFPGMILRPETTVPIKFVSRKP